MTSTLLYLAVSLSPGQPDGSGGEPAVGPRTGYVVPTPRPGNKVSLSPSKVNERVANESHSIISFGHTDGLRYSRARPTILWVD